MKDILGTGIGLSLFLLYIFGMYQIFTDDHRYTTKDVVIGAVFFPYAWWAGGKEGYRILTTSSEDRQFEEQCLDAAEAMGLTQNSRLRYCECLVETGEPEMCQARIFTK